MEITKKASIAFQYVNNVRKLAGFNSLYSPPSTLRSVRRHEGSVKARRFVQYLYVVRVMIFLKAYAAAVFI
jgi:hypothetical protein